MGEPLRHFLEFLEQLRGGLLLLLGFVSFLELQDFLNRGLKKLKSRRLEVFLYT